MKKVFIDCGAHFGEGLAYFAELYNIDETWEVHLFEPNPYVFTALHNHFSSGPPWETDTGMELNFNLILHPFAIAAGKEREVEMKLDGRGDNATPDGGGSSIISAARFREEEFKNYEETVTVKTANLSYYLTQLTAPVQTKDGVVHLADDLKALRNEISDDNMYVVVKLDIEGAEYEVMQELIDSTAGWTINHLYVEFHGRRFKEDMTAKEKELVGNLFHQGVTVHPWH